MTAIVLLPGTTYRHVMSHGEYEIVSVGKMQAKGWFCYDDEVDQEIKCDMHEVVIYRSLTDGMVWVRPREEFMDGRFELVHKELVSQPEPVSVVDTTEYVSVPRAFLEFVKTAPVASGVCCCGQPMDQHYDHQPVDQWEYSLERWLKDIGVDDAST